MANSQPIRIAIIGGGLAGASLIHALLKYAHLDVHIFESAPAFRENGMAVGIARNALTALDVLGPSAAQSLSRAGAVPQQGVRFKLGEGTDQGSLIAEADAEAEDRRLTSIVQRAAFLRELLANIPPDRMHASKKLASVDGCDDKNGPITLHFTDGSTHECDILVGADGIHSTVRKLILGEQDPASQPRNTGFWVIMILSPYEKAHNVLEKAFMDADDPHEYVWLGNDQMIMHNVLENGSLAQFVVGSIDPDAKGKSDLWQRKVSSEELTKFFDQGTPGLNKAVKEVSSSKFSTDSVQGFQTKDPKLIKKQTLQLLCDQTEQTAFYLWEHLPARTYASGPVCIIGDAAHATTPWQVSSQNPIPGP